MDNNTLGQLSRSIVNQQLQQSAQGVQGGSSNGSVLGAIPSAASAPSNQGNQQQNDASAQTNVSNGSNSSGTGNWFTHLLPTLGSIAAPIAGALLAPETGGASLLAGLALASGGSAAGKAAENVTEGQNITKDLGTSAIEGGVGQLAGGVLGKTVGSIAGVAGNAAEKAGVGMIQHQFGNQIDKATAQHLINNGLTDRGAAVDIANRITGSDGELPKTINDVFKNSDRVANISDLEPSQIQASDNSGVFNMDRAGLNPQSQKTALANAESILNSHMGPGDLSTVPHLKGSGDTPLYANGSLQNALPENVFAMAKNFENLSRTAADSAYDRAGTTVNAQQANLSKYYRSVADELNQRAFGVGQDAIPLTDDAKSALLSNFSDLEKTNPQAFSGLSKQINDAQNLQDLRSIQAPWVAVSKGDRVATALQNGTGGVSASDILNNAAPVIGASSGGAKGLATGIALKAANSPAANSAGAGIMSKISDMLSNSDMQRIVSGAATVPTQTVAHAPTDFTQGAGAGQSLAIPQGLDGSALMNNPSAINAIMNNNSIQGQVAKMELSAMMNPFSGQHGMDQAGMDSIKSLQGTASIQAQLPALIEAYNAAGGAQGSAGGLLHELGGAITGGPAAQYQQRANALRQEYQASTGQNLVLPSLTMNQGAAQSTLGQLVAAMNVNR